MLHRQQVRPQYALLCGLRSQHCIAPLQFGDFDGVPRCMAIQQHLGKIMQQCGLVYQRGIVIIPMNRECQGEASGAVRATHDAAQTVDETELHFADAQDTEFLLFDLPR
jgi:hypothetical protein